MVMATMLLGMLAEKSRGGRGKEAAAEFFAKFRGQCTAADLHNLAEFAEGLLQCVNDELSSRGQ